MRNGQSSFPPKSLINLFVRMYRLVGGKIEMLTARDRTSKVVKLICSKTRFFGYSLLFIHPKALKHSNSIFSNYHMKAELSPYNIRLL